MTAPAFPLHPLPRRAPCHPADAPDAAVQPQAHPTTHGSIAASIDTLIEEHRERRNTAGVSAVAFIEALLDLGHIPACHQEFARGIAAEWNEANDTVREAMAYQYACWTEEARR